jgi:hypothetical protein
MKDYYSILGVSRTSTSEDIKRSYRKLAVQYHPDKNPDPEAEQFFKEVNEAYDVLGDPQKKPAYDQRLDNPFAAIAEEAHVRTHRDPAYRRPRAHGRRPGPVVNPLQELMRQYLRYVIWFSFIGLGFTGVFFLDYILPYSSVKQEVTGTHAVKLRGNIAYYKVFTSAGERIKIYPSEDIVILSEERTVTLISTLIYGSPMSMTSESGTQIVLGYFYHGQIFLPLSLFFASLFGVLFRKNRIEASFNLSIVSAILLLINFVFI